MTLRFDNQFTVRRIDLDTFDFPEPKVRSWYDLLGNGSEVTITVEATTGDGKRLTLSSEKVHREDRSRAWQAAEYELEEWMEDNKGNWLREISRAASYVHEYNVKQAKEYTDAIDESAKTVSAAAILTVKHNLTKDES